MSSSKLWAGLLWALVAVAVTGQERQLTKDGRLKRDPIFVQGGKEVVYAVDESRALIRLMRLSVDNLSTKPLHPEANKTEYEASFSADGRIKAYSHNKGNLEMQLFIHDVKSGKVTKVVVVIVIPVFLRTERECFTALPRADLSTSFR